MLILEIRLTEARRERGNNGVMRVLRRTLQVLSPMIFTVILSAEIGYIPIKHFGNADAPSFEMATLSALLGGFVLTGGFLSGSSNALGMSLRRVGTLYLASTVSFAILGLFLPILKVIGDADSIGDYIVVWVTGISMVVGMIFFATATTWLIRILPEIWSKS